MPSLLTRLRSPKAPAATTDTLARNWLDSAGFTFNGAWQPTMVATTMDGSRREELPHNFEQMIRGVHHRSGVVSAAVVARCYVMAQIRFRWRRMFDDDQTLFGTSSLAPLEVPSPDVTRTEFLVRIEQDVSYAGNSYTRLLSDGRLQRLRPDWMQVIIGSDERPQAVLDGADAGVVGYAYRPGGARSGRPSQIFTLDEVAHFKPEPHPLSRFIGESWVTGVIREVLTDQQSLEHVSKFFENAATANMVITTPPEVTSPTQFNEWVSAFEESHGGVGNAWRNIYLSAGADADVVGADLAQLDLRNLSGGLETRVASRSRVPAAILGIREGMQGSALNASTYGQTRRQWADGWFVTHADGLGSAMRRIIDLPAGTPAELTFDPARIQFLQEDEADAAKIRKEDATTLGELFRSGWDPDAAVDFIRSGPAALQGRHVGLPSVQVQAEAAALPASTDDEE